MLSLALALEHYNFHVLHVAKKQRNGRQQIIRYGTTYSTIRWIDVHGNGPWLTWLGRHVPHTSVAVDDDPTQNLRNHISGHRCAVLTILLPVKIICPFPRSSQAAEYQHLWHWWSPCKSNHIWQFVSANGAQWGLTNSLAFVAGASYINTHCFRADLC